MELWRIIERKLGITRYPQSGFRPVFRPASRPAIRFYAACRIGPLNGKQGGTMAMSRRWTIGDMCDMRLSDGVQLTIRLG